MFHILSFVSEKMKPDGSNLAENRKGIPLQNKANSTEEGIKCVTHKAANLSICRINISLFIPAGTSLSLSQQTYPVKADPVRPGSCPAENHRPSLWHSFSPSWSGCRGRREMRVWTQTSAWKTLQMLQTYLIKNHNNSGFYQPTSSQFPSLSIFVFRPWAAPIRMFRSWARLYNMGHLDHEGQKGGQNPP